MEDGALPGPPLYFVQEHASLLKVGECLLIPAQRLGCKAQVIQGLGFSGPIPPDPIDAIKFRREQGG